MKNLTFISLCAAAALSMTCCTESNHDDQDCDDTYAAECLDTMHYSHCKEGKLTVETCDQGYYCESIAPGTNTQGSAKCSPTSRICNENEIKCENNAEWTCQNNQWNKTNSCTNGCFGSFCAIPEPCNCATGLNCTAEQLEGCSVVTPCDCTTGEHCSALQLAACPKPECTYTCDGNALHATCPGADSYSLTCAAGCLNDKCIDMVIEDKGQSCTASYPDRCVGNLLAYCTSGVVAASFCVGDSSCQISQKLDGFATCAKTCETPSEPENQCIYSEDYGFYYVVKSTCETAEDGHNYLFRQALDACYTGCNDNNTGCRFEKENADCTGSEKASCSADGKYSMYCYQDEEYGNFWTGDLCPEGTTCAVDNTGTASCIDPCSKEEVGQTQGTCAQVPLLFNIDAAGSKVCTEISDGVYAWVVDEKTLELCPKSCDPVTAQCLLLDEKEGQKCSDTSEDACKNDIAVYCDTSYQTMMAENCRDYGENYHCMTLNGQVGCVESCTELNATKTVCVNSDYESAVLDYKCIESDNGLIWFGTVNHYCNDACDETGLECQKLFEEEFSACTAESFPDQCIQGSAAWCENGKVSGLDCASDKQVCVVDETNFADCYSLCTTSGKVTPTCNVYTNIAATYTCTRLENGILVDIPATDSIKTCTKGCNQNNTGCAN